MQHPYPDAKGYQNFTKEPRLMNEVIRPLTIDSIPANTSTLLDLGCGTAEYHHLIIKEKPHLKRLVGTDSN